MRKWRNLTEAVLCGEWRQEGNPRKCLGVVRRRQCDRLESNQIVGSLLRQGIRRPESNRRIELLLLRQNIRRPESNRRIELLLLRQNIRRPESNRRIDLLLRQDIRRPESNR